MLLALAASCGGEPPSGTEQGNTARNPVDSDEAIRALEAIGYAGGVEEADGDRRDGVTLHDPQRAWQGLNLMTSGHGPEALLLDMQGRVLHRWRKAFEEVWPDRPGVGSMGLRDVWRRVRLEPDGSLFVIFEGLGLIKVDRNSELLWAFDGFAHHALDLADDGRIFVLTRKGRRIPSYNEERPVLEDFVSILDPEGNELERVSILECYENSGLEETLELVKKGGDVFHTNALRLLDGRHADLSPAFAAGNVLLSLCHPGELAVLDLARREVVWTLRGDWRLQHEPVLLENGHLLVFDNRGGRRRSRVLELDPLSGDLLWSYETEKRGDFFTKTCGANQRLPGGTTLITESESGRAFEVTTEGEIVWEYFSPYRTGEQDELVGTVFEMLRLDPQLTAAWRD